METPENTNIVPAVEEPRKRKVSFSQFQNWMNCPHRWFLDFVKGLRTFEDNLNTCFGTAIHESIQLYIQTLYTKGVGDADELNLNEVFKSAFDRELQDKKVKHTDDDYMEFSIDGDDILAAFQNVTNRMKHFPSNKYEFVSVEDEIIVPIKYNVEFICYIDVVLKEKQTGRYKILDIKTSSTGWNTYMKEDPSKTSQILLYKAFFSKKYNVPITMIDVEFYILKRKLFENVNFPQTRIQPFVPKNDKSTIANTLNIFAEFVTTCFTPNGTFVENVASYPKIPGKYKKHCKWCPHRKTNCDAKSDVKEEELD